MIIKRLPEGERHYLTQIKAALAAERSRGHLALGGQLGDEAGPLDGLLDQATGAIRGQLDELRTALTVSTAASVAAAVGVVLLLFRTGGQGGRRKRRR
jgi:hypothetical protein